MEYKKLGKDNLNTVVQNYVDYYNNAEGGCWTFQKAYTRIHQVLTTEGSECLVQYADGAIVGFVMGYYKQFDDLLGYFLEEIVVFQPYQNKGYGTMLMNKLEETIKPNGASLIELYSVNDQHHAHFYGKMGFYAAKNLVSMGKHLD